MGNKQNSMSIISNKMHYCILLLSLISILPAKDLASNQNIIDNDTKNQNFVKSQLSLISKTDKKVESRQEIQKKENTDISPKEERTEQNNDKNNIKIEKNQSQSNTETDEKKTTKTNLKENNIENDNEKNDYEENFFTKIKSKITLGTSILGAKINELFGYNNKNSNNSQNNPKLHLGNTYLYLAGILIPLLILVIIWKLFSKSNSK